MIGLFEIDKRLFIYYLQEETRYYEAKLNGAKVYNFDSDLARSE